MLSPGNRGINSPSFTGDSNSALVTLFEDFELLLRGKMSVWFGLDSPSRVAPAPVGLRANVIFCADSVKGGLFAFLDYSQPFLLLDAETVF
jgi:hypothetical protein